MKGSADSGEEKVCNAQTPVDMLMDIRRRKEIRGRFVSDGGSGGSMIWPPKHEHESVLVVEKT
jgi:hypothetical protein